jgi:hypothetical protein
LKTKAAVAALLLTSCASARLECRVHGGPEWFEASSPHFVVRTNLPQSEARETTRTLEQLLQAMLWTIDYRVDAERISTVVLGEDQLSVFGYDLVGFVPAGGESKMFLEAYEHTNLGGRIPVTATHELAHVVAGWAFPWIPRWLNEGYASWLETATLKDEQTIKLGAGLPGYAELVWLKGPAPMASLWSWGQAEEPVGDAREALYATSWAVVHYLANHERERFLLLLDAFRDGREKPKEAFDRVFPRFEQEQLPAAVKHINGGTYTAVTLTLPAPPPPVVVKVVMPSSVHTTRGELWKLSQRLDLKERERHDLEELNASRVVGAQEPPDRAPLNVDATVFSEPDLSKPFPKDARARKMLATTLQLGHPQSVAWLKSALELNPGDEELEARLLLNQAAVTDDRNALDAFAARPQTARPNRLAMAGLAAALLGDCKRVERFVQLLRADSSVRDGEEDPEPWAQRLARVCEPAVIDKKCLAAGQAGFDKALDVAQASNEQVFRTYRRMLRLLDRSFAEKDFDTQVMLHLNGDGSLEPSPMQGKPAHNPLVWKVSEAHFRRLRLPAPCAVK